MAASPNPPPPPGPPPPTQQQLEEHHRNFERRDATRNYVLLLLALLMNIGQGIWNVRMSARQSEMEKQKLLAEIRLNSANTKSAEQSGRFQRIQHENEVKINSIDIHQKYMFVYGQRIYSFLQETLSWTFKDDVFEEFKRWLPSRSDNVAGYKTYEQEGNSSAFLEHSIVILDLRNRNKITAKKLS